MKLRKEHQEAYSVKFERMREAGTILSGILEHVLDSVEPGITTDELDGIAMKLFSEKQVKPAFLGYRGFPKSLCTSLNEEVVHGIPSNRKLKDGDILTVDIGLEYRGYCSDMAKTVPVGSISSEAADIIDAGERTLERAISSIHPGMPLRNLCSAIQEYAEGRGFNVLRKYVGHEIGRKMHEELQIPNFTTPGYPAADITLEPGTVIAIEPMLTQGTYEVIVADDDWTVQTKDGKLSSHFEHTVAINSDGIEVFTL